MMIKIYSFMIWINLSWNNTICNFSRFIWSTQSHYISYANSFSAFLPTAFKLVGSYCATP